MTNDRRVRLRAGSGRSPKQTRKPLSITEILQLEEALIEVFRTIRRLRELSSVARHIKFPSLPAAYSESIAIAATPLLFGIDWRGEYGGRESDLIVQNSARDKRLRVEVKATARHAFQEVKQKDLQADVLLWIRFGTCFETGCGPIEVAMINAPGRYIHKPCRLDVRRLENLPGITQAQTVHTFQSLRSMLELVSSGGQRE